MKIPILHIIYRINEQYLQNNSGLQHKGARLQGRKHNGANAEARTKPKGYEGSTQQPEDMPCSLNFLKTFAFIKS